MQATAVARHDSARHRHGGGSDNLTLNYALGAFWAFQACLHSCL
jgi:hypothetical protein